MIDPVEKIIKEWSWRCEKGYPDINNSQDRIILENILKDYNIDIKSTKKKKYNTITTLNESKESDLVTIFDLIGDVTKLNKVEIFNKLAEFTYTHYKSELKGLTKIFPQPISILTDWKKYVDDTKKFSNEGLEVENALINFAILNDLESRDVSDTGRGLDAIIDGVKIEIKSKRDDKINTMLQTTFYNSEKVYCFASNTSSNDLQIRLVHGKLLRELSLGQELVKDGEVLEEKLLSDVQKGLDQLPLAEMIKTSIVHGPVDRTTSFFIGNKLKVRFVIYFEPAYGKGRGKTKE